MRKWMGLVLVCLFLHMMVSACSSDNDGSTDGDVSDGDTDTEETEADGNEMEDGDSEQPEPSLAERLGLTQYCGLINPIEFSSDGDVTTYRFDPAEGPVCMRGSEFHTGVRETQSDDLVIFLQGGGACWSEFCLAVTGAPEGVPDIDILNRELEENPVADWNVVYLPYCDGSFFVGDAEYDDNINDNGKRYHYGLANVTAAFEVAKMRFPEVGRILLSGSSGGAYGLLLAGPLLRHYYPDAELIIMADSGIGLARDGEPDYLQTVLDEFNVTRFFPDDCPTCLDNGHIAGYLGYFLDHDENVRAGLYSSWYDSILATTFLQIPGEQFAQGLQQQTDRIHDAHPDRFRRFITDGVQHTTLLGDPSGIIGSDFGALELPPGSLTDLMANVVIGSLDETRIGEIVMSQWLAALIENDLDVWVDILEEKGPAPE